MRRTSYFLRAFVFCGALLLAAPVIVNAAPGDENITKAVQHKLMGSGTDFDATNIIVNTDNGEVYLRGSVKRPDEVQRIKNAAEMVPGVKSVKTQIDVMRQGS